ncbi:MAG: DegV family protein [Chloroflexi bacterium]|nr:DegV family protein [Chloroflexota bacterium]MBI5291478.1 DegV family protein [Chloroflexota bacterium]
MTISLVTDSTADVPADLVARYGISVAPTLLVAGGQTFRDGLDSRMQYNTPYGEPLRHT